MPTRILEYATNDVRMPLIEAPALVEQPAITATSTSQQSALLNAQTNMVCVQSDEAVYVAVGSNPVASANSYRLQTGGENFWRVPKNSAFKVAVRS